MAVTTRRSLWVGLLTALLAAAPSVSWAQGDLGALLAEHFEAVNRGDVAEAMATFTDDAALARGSRCPPATPCVGRAAIQRQVDGEVATSVRRNLISFRVSDETLTARAEERGLPFEDAGVERVIVNVTANFRGDKIARLVHLLDLSDPQSVAFRDFFRVSAVTTRYLDALSRGDVPGLGAILTEDAVFEGFGLCELSQCVGKAAIQREIESEVADKISITRLFGTARVSGDTLIARLEIQSNSIRAAAAGRIVGSVTQEARDGKISFLRFALDPTDPETRAYLAWPPVQPIVVLNQDQNPATFSAYVLNRSHEPADIDLRLFLSGGTVVESWAASPGQNRGTLARLAGGWQEVGWITVGLPGRSMTGPYVAEVDPGAEQVAGRAVANFITRSFNSRSVSTDVLAHANPWALHQAFLDAVARGNAGAASALFTDDAVVEGRGACPAGRPCVGKEAIQQEIERVVGVHTRTAIAGSQVHGNISTDRIEAQSDETEAAGVDRIVGIQTVEARGDKLAALRFVIDRDDPQTAAFLAFLQAQRLRGGN